MTFNLKKKVYSSLYDLHFVCIYRAQHKKLVGSKNELLTKWA